ncbi:MAG: PAS domain-containing protein [Deltaproteobacteria bacterium]|nr:PAS domain-containing protein [Deltaproteobacteria bacterium]
MNSFLSNLKDEAWSSCKNTQFADQFDSYLKKILSNYPSFEAVTLLQNQLGTYLIVNNKKNTKKIPEIDFSFIDKKHSYIKLIKNFPSDLNRVFTDVFSNAEKIIAIPLEYKEDSVEIIFINISNSEKEPVHEDLVIINDILNIAYLGDRRFNNSSIISQFALDALFSSSAYGVFLMMTDYPVSLNEDNDKNSIIEHVSMHQKITRINQELLRQYDANENDLLGITPMEFFSYYENESGKSAWKRSLNDAHVHYHIKIHPTTHDTRILEGDIICIFDSNGCVIGHLGIQTDVTGKVEYGENLETREQNFGNFMNTVDDMLSVLDINGNIIWNNPSLEKTLGYKPGELIGKNVLIVHPVEKHTEALKTVMEMMEGKADSCPIPLISKENKYIPAETRVFQGKWDNREVLFGITKNLTQLKHSEEKFFKAFEASPSLIAITDLKTAKFVDVNLSFLEKLGYERSEVINKSPWELKMFAQNGQRDEAFSLIEKNGSLRNFIVKVRKKNNEILIGSFSADFIHLQDGKYLLTIMEDITEKTLFEEERNKLLESFRSIISNLQVGILVETSDSTIIHANEYFCKIFNISSPSQIVGQKCSDAAEKASEGFINSKKFLSEIKETIRNNVQVTNLELQLKDGRFFERDYAPLTLHSGFSGHMWIYRDISHRKNYEKSIIRQKKLETAGQLTAGIAHEFNNILASIGGFSDMILTYDEISDNLRNDLTYINDGTKKASILVKQMLDYSRKNILQLKKVLPAVLIPETVGELMNSFPGEIEFHVKNISADVMLTLDPEGFKKALTNICINAANSMNQKGTIIIETAYTDTVSEMVCSGCGHSFSGNYFTVAVKDSGCGINENLLNKIFDPFFTTREVGKGTGLGLSQVYGILAQHGGHITVASSPLGSTFSLYFPV